MHVPPSAARAEAWLRRHLEALRSWVEKTILWQLWERLVENEFIERSVALAAKAFVSLFPALIVVAAFLPASARNSVLSTMLRRLGVEGSKSVKQAFAGSSDVRRATGVLGLLFTFFYINSFITALQRIYLRVWRRPKVGAAYGYAIGAAWLVGVIAYLGLIGGVRAVLGHGPETLAFAVIALAFTIATWTVTPWIMLKRQIRFRALIATGIVTGTGLAAYGVTASLWMPSTVGKNEQQFGVFGIALALVTWLTGATTIVVVGACVSPVLAEDTGVLGRLVRGPDGVMAPVDPPPAQSRPNGSDGDLPCFAMDEHEHGERFGAAAQTAEWDARYRERDGAMWSGQPNGRLVAEAGDLTPGRALDVGCGEGADAIWFARRGWTVTAIDISDVAVSRARQAAERAGAEVEWVCGDALQSPFAARSFDLVSMQYPALPKAAGEAAVRTLIETVHPGGLLLAVYHDLDDEHREHMKSQGFDPADYIGADDLGQLLGEDFTIELHEVEPRIDPPPGAPHIADVVLRARRR